MKYDVKIENIPFYKVVNSQIVKLDKTASVTFIDDNGETTIREYGVVQMEEIRQTIDSGEDIDLDKYYIEGLDLSNCKIKSFRARYSENKVCPKVSHWDRALQFRLLKENFKNLGQYDDEDSAYIAFRQQIAEYELLEKDEKSKWKRILFRNKAWHRIKWFCMDVIGEYGTNPSRIAIALFLNIVIFAFIYWGIGGVAGNELGKFHPILSNFYFSAITSFTVGYGDLSPSSNLAAGLACLEAFIGVFLMSYFIVAYSRRVLR